MPRPTERQPWRVERAFARDERGQMLILAGVILVLGFVIVGSTLIQLQNVGEETARLERESLVGEFMTLLATFNETLGDATDVGNVNVDDFAKRMERVELDVRALTTKRGLVLEAERDGSAAAAAEADVTRPSRCASPSTNTAGIITGVESATGRLSIVGVVYRVWITDGQETIHDTVYFRFHQCVVNVLTTPFDTFLAEQSDLGTEPPVGFPDGLRTKSDGLTVSLAEAGELGETVSTTRLHVSGVDSDTAWTQEARLVGDGDAQEASTNALTNTLTASFDDPTFAGANVESVKISLRGRIAAGGLGMTFHVTPVLNGVDGVTGVLVPSSSTSDMGYDITNLRPGGGAWTAQDVRDLKVRIVGVDALAPTGTFYADNATLVVRAQSSWVYNGHAVFQRTELPDYERHWLIMNTTVASDETVRLDLFNWTLADGAGDWEPWNAHVAGTGEVPPPGTGLMRRLHDAFHISANDIVRVRFTFTATDDATASALVVDELRIKSVLD